MSTINDEQRHTEAATSTKEDQPIKKARRAAQKAHVAPAKAKSGKKASKGKPALKSQKKAKSARAGSKTEAILGMLRQKGSATLGEIMKATGWQAHSVRGFISGTLGKDGPGCGVRKGAGRIAQLLAQRLILTFASFRPPAFGRGRLSYSVVDLGPALANHGAASSRKRAISSKDRPSPSSTAFCPTYSWKRRTMTSAYLASSSISRAFRP